METRVSQYRWSKRLQGILALLLVLSMVLAGCGGSSAGKKGEPGTGEYRLGVILPLTGAQSDWGKGNEIAARAFEKTINAKGGIKGVPVKLFIEDSALKPENIPGLMRKLANDHKVLAIGGPFTSSEVEVGFPVSNQLGIVVMAQASSKAGLSEKNRPWPFRNTIDEVTFAKKTVPALLKDHPNIKTAAIAYDAKDAVSTFIGKTSLPGELKAKGVTILNEDKPITFTTTDLDFSFQVTALKQLNPDVVILGAFPAPAVKFLAEMKRQNVKIPVIGGVPLNSSTIASAFPEVDVYMPSTYYAGSSAAKAKEFTEAWYQVAKETANVPQGLEPTVFDGQLYEILWMYVEAIEKGGVTNKPEDLAKDRERIRDYIAQLKGFQGLTGSISIKPNGDADKDFFVLKARDGKLVEYK